MTRLLIVAITVIVLGCEKDPKAPPPAVAAPVPAAPVAPAVTRRVRSAADLALFMPRREHVFPPGESREFRTVDGRIVRRSPTQHPYLIGIAAVKRYENLVRHHESQPTLIGGFAAAPNGWPWHVAFLDSREIPYCGGTLIAPGWVLTAAHCGPSVRDTFMIGGTSLADLDGEIVRMAFFCTHKDYDSTIGADLALLRLQRDATTRPGQFTRDASLEAPGIQATAIGWGWTDRNLALRASVLQQASFPIVSNAECLAAYPNEALGTVLCAGEKGAIVGPCDGDSGGPLLVSGPLGWLQIGVTSWGDACNDDPPFPYGAYTRISQYADWIDTTMTSDNPECKED